jgi:hypothetical protein
MLSKASAGATRRVLLATPLKKVAGIGGCGDIMGYHHAEGCMSDVLIRDVPDDVLAALDQRAARLGLSRTEYIRRCLAQDARMTAMSVTADDWRKFAGASSDLANPAVMDRAWK